MNFTTQQLLLRIEGGEREEIKDEVIKEFKLKVVVNDKQIVTLACSPVSLKELGIGYLYAEGIIQSIDEIKSLDRQADKLFVNLSVSLPENITPEQEIVTSGCGNNIIYTKVEDVEALPLTDEVKLTPEKIYQLMKELYSSAEVFKRTGGTHSGLIAGDEGRVIAFREDIGRHNVVDKLVGHLLKEKISVKDKILVISGRISAEILIKTARVKTPVLISRSAPTDQAIKLARELGITVVGFVRGKRMNIYTDCDRIKH